MDLSVFRTRGAAFHRLLVRRAPTVSSLRSSVLAVKTPIVWRASDAWAIGCESHQERAASHARDRELAQTVSSVSGRLMQDGQKTRSNEACVRAPVLQASCWDPMVVQFLTETLNGRYLSPEPLLQDPSWVRNELEDGHQAPAYSYARNNPVSYSDPTGLSPGDKDGSTTCAPGTTLLKEFPECSPVRGICVKDDWAKRDDSSKCARCQKMLPQILRWTKDGSRACRTAVAAACDDICSRVPVCSR
jgi:hypothetical protein